MQNHTHQIRTVVDFEHLRANIVDTPFSNFELFNAQEQGLSNVWEIVNWLMDRGYNGEIVHRDPHNEAIGQDRDLWLLSFVFDDVAAAIHMRLRWSGDGEMWIYESD